MNRGQFRALVLLWCGMLWCGTAAAKPARALPVDPPVLTLSWNAPWGEPRAVTGITADCADTSGADTLYLTVRSERHVLPLWGMTGTLLFEPMQGDTLGSFWDLERGGKNAGSLLIDFDIIGSEHCTVPWKTLVTGRVGYSHAGGRGRLDVSADVPKTAIYNLYPGECYIVARVTIQRRGGLLAGCRRPMRITWAGARFRSTRVGSEAIYIGGMGPNRSVTWNAPVAGIARRRTALAIETWTPRFAPPSWAAMAPVHVAAPAPSSNE